MVGRCGCVLGLRARPLGWRLTRYLGVADGRKELKGYWQDRKAADPSA